MRVLHYSTWKEKCGIAAYTEDLVNALTARGVESGVHAVDKQTRRYMTAREVRADMAAFCKKARDFDLVHIQHEFSFFNDATNHLGQSLNQFVFALAQLKRQRTPFVVTFHTEPYFLLTFQATARLVYHHRFRARYQVLQYLDSRKWYRGIAAAFTPERSRAIVHSRKTKLKFAATGFPPEAMEVVPLGLVPRQRTAALTTPRSQALEQLGYAPDTVLLSLFGFVAAYKGPDLALKALRHLPPNYHLAIVGGPHPEANDLTLNNILAMAAHERDLRGRLRVTGYATPEQLDLYHAATSICLAPYQNTDLSGSSALTWALSSGKPVIASKIGAFLEVQERGDCLLLFTEGAEHELAWQVRRLMDDPAMQGALVRKALAYVEQNSWPHVAAATHGIYEALMGTESVRAAVSRAA